LVNLIRNAADAIAESDRPGGEVRITAMPLTRDGADWASVAIEDPGPGIDPEMISTLFAPFTSTRLDSRGAGLGLAVSEGIVREHGGLLTARNRPEGGAVFEILLPARAPARA